MPRRLVLVAFAIVSIVWGSTYLAIRIAIETFPPFFLGAVRFVIAGVVLLAVAWARGEPVPTRREQGSAAVTGVLFFVIGNGLINVAERSVSSGIASVLVATMPLWATVFGRVFGRETSPREMAGLVLGLAGVVILNLGGGLWASPAGAACGLLAPIGWALGSVASHTLPLPSGIMRTATQMLYGGVAMLLVSLALQEHLGPVTLGAAVALAYLVVFGSLIGFTAYSYLLRHTRPAVATAYAYVNPVIAVLLGVLMAGERFGVGSAAGALVVLAAVALVQTRRNREPAAQVAPATPRGMLVLQK